MNDRSPWFSLIFLVFGYAVLVFLVSCLVESTMGVAIVYAYAIFYPMVMLSGAWAVLGPGSYLVRTVTSIGAVFAILFAGAFSLVLVSLARRNAFGEELMSVESLIVVAGFGIPLIVAAQIPFWLVRLIFGWQLVDQSKPLKAKRLDIKEMLVITAVLAVVLVAPSQAVSTLSNRFVQQIQLGDYEYGPVADPTTGEVAYEQVEVTAANIETFRKERAANVAQGRGIGFWLVIGYAVAIAITTLVNIPSFYLGMMLKGESTAMMWSVFYWLGVFFVLFVVMTVVTQPSGNVLGGMIPYFAFLAVIFAVSASLPMFVARLNGAKLVGRSDFRNTLKNEKLAVPEKTPDPFAD